jgi:5-formyltetrahydrofolate cyclo-ligase
LANKDSKQQLRKELLKRRSELNNTEYNKKSGRIVKTLKNQPEFDKATVIHCYVSMNDRKEVNTHPLIKDLILGEKRLAVPITNFKDVTLSHKYLEKFEDLQENKWGVLEPKFGKQADLEDFELVIVPMVGGDYDKNRIGYGKGFYDRFLQQVKCPTIGLLFDRCLIEEIPVEPFDIALDKCITENNVIV